MSALSQRESGQLLLKSGGYNWRYKKTTKIQFRSEWSLPYAVKSAHKGNKICMNNFWIMWVEKKFLTESLNKKQNFFARASNYYNIAFCYLRKHSVSSAEMHKAPIIIAQIARFATRLNDNYSIVGLLDIEKNIGCQPNVHFLL